MVPPPFEWKKNNDNNNNNNNSKNNNNNNNNNKSKSKKKRCLVSFSLYALAASYLVVFVHLSLSLNNNNNNETSNSKNVTTSETSKAQFLAPLQQQQQLQQMKLDQQHHHQKQKDLQQLTQQKKKERRTTKENSTVAAGAFHESKKNIETSSSISHNHHRTQTQTEPNNNNSTPPKRRRKRNTTITHQRLKKILTAYIERVNRSEWEIQPLPVRSLSTASETLLQTLEFPTLTCETLLQGFWPVDGGGEENCVEEKEQQQKQQQQQSTTLPTLLDPFLPWIHDVFPTRDGSFLQIVAQNRRRCRSNDTDTLHFMEPQVSLFQPSPVQRIVLSSEDDNDTSTTKSRRYSPVGSSRKRGTVRYRLASFEEADPDSYMTRFICRFHGGDDKETTKKLTNPEINDDFVEKYSWETLSEFNFDYDYATFRKRIRGWRKEHGNNKMLHTSQLIFRCPVPPHLQPEIAAANSYPTTTKDRQHQYYLDLIPIRTPPRYGPADSFFQPKYQTMAKTPQSEWFNATLAYGTNHILPALKDSGRWANIPICPLSPLPRRRTETRNHSSSSSDHTMEDTGNSGDNCGSHRRHHHRLIACMWSSVSYTTRGSRDVVADGRRRLYEWIHYHQLIGYDHFYLYDNSAAAAAASSSLAISTVNVSTLKSATTTTGTTFRDIAALFPQELVTYIPWPYKICNNNDAKHPSPGERSSQYAAESSCRLRFGPDADWIGQFDLDEYFVPSGNFSDALQLLDDLDRQDIRAVSFPSLRARVRRKFIRHPIEPIRNKTICQSPAPCFYLSIPDNVTLLQAFNCEKYGMDQKVDPDPAEKQFYRPDYVLQHFVHYSAVTELLQKNKSEYDKEGYQFTERKNRDPRTRMAKEATEGYMIHAKSVSVRSTAGYNWQCGEEALKLPPNRRGDCLLGVPFPVNKSKEEEEQITDNDGLVYNCYVNQRVEQELVPKLEAAMRATHSGAFVPPPNTANRNVPRRRRAEG